MSFGTSTGDYKSKLGTKSTVKPISKLELEGDVAASMVGSLYPDDGMHSFRKTIIGWEVLHRQSFSCCGKETKSGRSEESSYVYRPISTAQYHELVKIRNENEPDSSKGERIIETLWGNESEIGTSQPLTTVVPPDMASASAAASAGVGMIPTASSALAPPKPGRQGSSTNSSGRSTKGSRKHKRGGSSVGSVANPLGPPQGIVKTSVKGSRRCSRTTSITYLGFDPQVIPPGESAASRPRPHYPEGDTTSRSGTLERLRASEQELDEKRRQQLEEALAQSRALSTQSASSHMGTQLGFAGSSNMNWLTPGNMTMEPQPGFGLGGQEAAGQYSQGAFGQYDRVSQYGQNWAGLNQQGTQGLPIDPEVNQPTQFQPSFGYSDPMADSTNIVPDQTFKSPGIFTPDGRFIPSMGNRPIMTNDGEDLNVLQEAFSLTDPGLMMPEPSGGPIGAPLSHDSGPHDPNFQGFNDRYFIGIQPQQQNVGSLGTEGDPQVTGVASFVNEFDEFIDLESGDAGVSSPNEPDFGMQDPNID